VIGTEETDLWRFRLDVDLAEYNRCFAEISARFTYQTAAFTILAAGIGAIFAFGKLTEPQTAALVCLFAPLFIAPLGFIFDNELQIWRVARYMRYTLRLRVASLSGDTQSLAVDDYSFGTIAARRTIPFLSVGRWLIFLVPAVGAAVLAARALSPQFGPLRCSRSTSARSSCSSLDRSRD
jgi:hypothetical protein